MSAPRELILPSSGLLVKDDFLSNDAVADAAIGELNWELVTIGNASTPTFVAAQPHGVLRLTTAATANGDGGAIRLKEDALVLLPGFEWGARFRYPIELASLNFRIGLDDSVTATRPTVGVTIEGDAGVLTVHADSADHGDNAAAVLKHPDLAGTNGNTMIVGEFIDVKAVGSGRANPQGGPDSVDFWINGVHVATVPCAIDDDEEVEPKIVTWQDSGSADAVTFDIDYWYFWQPRH